LNCRKTAPQKRSQFGGKNLMIGTSSKLLRTSSTLLRHASARSGPSPEARTPFSSFATFAALGCGQNRRWRFKAESYPEGTRNSFQTIKI